MSVLLFLIMKVITLFSLVFLLFTGCSKFKTPSTKIRQEVDSLLDLAHSHHLLIDTEKSLKYSFEALEMAQSENFRMGIAESYFYIAQALFDTGNYDKSIQYVIQGEEYADGDPKLTSEFIRIRGRIYSYLELQDKAKNEFLKGLTYTRQISQKVQREYFTALAYENLSHLYTILEKPDSALLYTQKEIEVLASMDESLVYSILINAYVSFPILVPFKSRHNLSLQQEPSSAKA